MKILGHILKFRPVRCQRRISQSMDRLPRPWLPRVVANHIERAKERWFPEVVGHCRSFEILLQSPRTHAAKVHADRTAHPSCDGQRDTHALSVYLSVFSKHIIITE